MLNSRILYKYLAAERTDVLDKNLLRFTQATAFNDPFETLPFTESIFDPGWIEYAIDQVAKKKPGLATALSLFKAPLARQIQLESPGAKKIAAEFMQQFFSSRFGCLCLSAAGNPDDVPDNLLMWSHYADCHRGFVVGFDKEHRYFHQPEPRKPFFGEITPVRYRLERPRGPIVNDPTDCESAIYYQFAVRFFLRKSQHWSYENEWRMIRELKDADSMISVGDEQVYLFAFPPSALMNVVLGCRIANDVENRIGDLLSDERYSHVKVYRAKIDPREFKLNIEIEDRTSAKKRDRKPSFRDPANREKLQEAWPALEKVIARGR